jgi:hypothetical protein
MMECLLAKIYANLANTGANLKEMREEMKASLELQKEEMLAKMETNQDRMEAKPG